MNHWLHATEILPVSIWEVSRKGSHVHVPDYHHPSTHRLYITLLSVLSGHQSRHLLMVQEEAGSIIHDEWPDKDS